MNITNLADIIILLVILLWGVLGLKRGVIKQGVMTIGMILVFVLAFYLKNPVAEFLSLNLPFFSFGGIFKGVTSINIIVYQLLAFILVVCLLQVALNIIIKVSSLIETILKFTVILAIPSKILGFILGLVEGFVVVYITLFFLTQPVFNLGIFDESKLTPKVLENAPGLSNVASGMVHTFNELYEVGKEYYSEDSTSNEFNLQAIRVMLKNKIITVDYVDKLVEKDKIKITGLDSVLNEYR